MAVESDVQSEEDKDNDNAGVENPITNNGAGTNVIETVEDESEDEDVDFNPFMKGSPSEEASSSLSSEVEVLDSEVVNSRCEDVVSISQGVSDHVECLIDKFKEVGQENGTVRGIENGSTSRTNVVEDDCGTPMDLRDAKVNSPTVYFDEEDAICKRTRARYSLASFTLDELETFLQETDDDDDFQNVDEEEEYRKFLTAVLKGGDGDDQGNVEGNDEDDDDEDNDADFEIEIEEALESDVDECLITSHNDGEVEKSRRRPKTRQKRRQKTPALSKKKGVKLEERPLRPLVPIMFSALNASVPCLGAKFATNPSHTQSLQSIGFVGHQIGQLYCLIYEHVQLLIQVYSLCVLDPSRQHIAVQVKGFLSELLHKRDLVLAWRNDAYPTSCFVAQYLNSVSDRTQNCIPYSSIASDVIDGQGCRWLPPIGGPVLSVLDVEPLKLVGKYIDDVSNAVREHQKRCVETTNYYLEKEPLFPHPVSPSPEVNCNATRGDDPTPDACAVSPNDKVPKKTLAATLVESTKKQSVALVPQQIAKLAQPFYPLFNSALFPHKPPSPSVASRVLFTDAEDVLLAMGMMEYNNSWKAIQQRFLPCKSEHQIFVRAKNRCSSKAPNNPIKTVRKLKTSPFTEDEKARIQEGLNTFRLDWTSVWRAVVPYRDPNLLPRQWRIATGTQKSYKVDSGRKEKHRIYELDRRRRKAVAMGNSHTTPEDNQIDLCGRQNGNGKDGGDNVNEAYVHEAFLADWRPFTAGLNAPKVFTSNINSRCLPGDLVSSRVCDSQEVPNNHGNKETQCMRDRARDFSVGSENFHHVNHKSFHAYMGSGYPPLLHSQRSQKPGISNLVKLAPELPPVKLPPAVRVISQASLRSSQLVSTTEVGTAGHGLVNSVFNPTAVNCAANLEKPVQDKTREFNSNSASVSSQNCETLNDRSLGEDKGVDLDPQMHPLLYRSLEEGHVPSFSVNNSSRISTFSFFPAFQKQTSENLLRNPHLPTPPAGRNCCSSKEIASTSSSLDFHPLLQRASDFNAKPFGSDSTSSLLTTNLELSRDQYVEDLFYRAGTDAAQLAAAGKPTNPDTDANDLDLGIHLSSSRKRKALSHEGSETNPIVPSVSVGDFVEGAKGRSYVTHLPSDLVAAEDIGKPSSDDSSSQLDKLGGNSSLEIVMEQEELSDSDEEMEDVEFECEEMTDSDGEEGSPEEQIVNTTHKEQEKTSLVMDINARCSKSGTCEVSEGSRAPRKKTPRKDSARLGKGCTKGSWLSLNSRDSHHTEQAGANSTQTLEHSKRCSRKAPSSRKNSLDEQKTMSSRSNPLPSSSRKHRKQVIKAPFTSVPDVAVVNAGCTKDGEV